MTDLSRSNPTEPLEPIAGPPHEPFPASAPVEAGTQDGATFSGRTPRKAESLRIAMIAGTALVVVLGAAVAMGASPSASDAAGGAGASSTPSGAPGAAVPNQRAGGKGPGDGFGRGGPGKGDGREFGQISVTAIAGSDLSLATADGWTRTITAASTTTITRAGAAATLADIAVGDAIRFQQTRNADGTYTITAIQIIQPSAAGTVTAVGSDTITITLRGGTSQTIATTEATTYRLGKNTGARSDVAVGTTIFATGEKSSDGTLTASTVVVRLPHVVGRVTATTADTVTITRRDGTSATIHVAAGTTIEVRGIESATVADVKVGMVIGVAGTQRADGSIDAINVHAGKLGLGRDKGEVTPDGTAPDASPAPDASSDPGG